MMVTIDDDDDSKTWVVSHIPLRMLAVLRSGLGLGIGSTMATDAADQQSRYRAMEELRPLSLSMTDFVTSTTR